MVTIYKNNSIPNEYKFIDIHDYYIDFYNTDNIVSDQNYSIYRVYKENEDLFINLNVTSYDNLSLIEVATSDSYIYKENYKDLCVTFFIYFLFIIFLLNIVTSVFRKNGVLGGLI